MKAKILMIVGVAIGSVVAELFAIPYNKKIIREEVKEEMNEIFEEAGIERRKESN